MALVHIPLALARPLVGLAARFGTFSPVTPDQLAMLNEDSTCDAVLAGAAFGVELRPIEPVFDDAAQRTAEAA